MAVPLPTPDQLKRAAAEVGLSLTEQTFSPISG